MTRHPTMTAIMLAMLMAPPGRAQPAEPLPRGHVFYASDFESDAATAGWSGAIKLDAGHHSPRALRVEQGTAGQTATCFLPLPAEQLRGYSVYCSARVRAEKVSARPQPWNGIKVMLVIETPGGKLWPQADLDVGTFDWRKAIFAVRVPKDATSVGLCVGLEQVTGIAWFDDVRISVHKPPRPPRPATAPAPAPAAHGLGRLRGAMVGPDIDEAGLRTLGREWNANLIRWQLIRYMPDRRPPPLEAYDAWLDGELSRLDRVLPWCRKYGLMVALDLHSPPGGGVTPAGYIGSDAGLFSDRAAQKKFVEVWQRMARRYRGNPAIWGFDLANEPVENTTDEGLDDWHDLATRAGRAIREIDPQRTLIVEPPDWGAPAGLKEFEPIDLPNIVYSVHMYVPAAFTHQSLYGIAAGQAYPGEIDGRKWNAAALEAELQPVIAFQRANGVPIYIGEFSAIRWAPDDSACRYLKDVIDVFEKHGWDWSYHAFREWHGWSVEHGPDRADTRPAAQPTSRQMLLREWFRRNDKPKG